jgi:hypothetical protein
MTTPDDVYRCALTFRCHLPVGAPVPVWADLTWRSSDPAVIAVEFRSPKRCEWVLGRDLLSDGLMSGTEAEPVGLGDVKVWTAVVGDESEVWIQLHTPDGFIRMSTAEQPFAEFVLETYDVVSAEDQWGVDVEKLLADVLD